MAWPSGESELASFVALVRAMRDLGVVSAFGVTLGPPPSKVHELTAAARDAPPERKAVLEQEIAEELRHQRIEALCEEYRDKLAATGREYSNEEILAQFVPAERLREIGELDA